MRRGAPCALPTLASGGVALLTVWVSGDRAYGWVTGVHQGGQR